MMEWTDTYYRHMARLMTKHTWLYTEMVVDKTLIYNPVRCPLIASPRLRFTHRRRCRCRCRSFA